MQIGHIGLADPLIGEEAERGEEIEKIPSLKFTTDKQTLMNYHSSVPQQILTPSTTPDGFTKAQIKNLQEGPKQKYCIGLLFQGSIHLLYSVLIIGDNIFACTAKKSINNMFAKFDISKLTSPMGGLYTWDISPNLIKRNTYPCL